MERRYEQRAAFGTRRHEMYVAIMAEVRDITARIQRSAEA